MRTRKARFRVTIPGGETRRSRARTISRVFMATRPTGLRPVPCRPAAGIRTSGRRLNTPGGLFRWPGRGCGRLGLNRRGDHLDGIAGCSPNITIPVREQSLQFGERRQRMFPEPCERLNRPPDSVSHLRHGIGRGPVTAERTRWRAAFRRCVHQRTLLSASVTPARDSRTRATGRTAEAWRVRNRVRVWPGLDPRDERATEKRRLRSA